MSVSPCAKINGFVVRLSGDERYASVRTFGPAVDSHMHIKLQICVTYCLPSIHNIRKDKMQYLKLGYIWLNISAINGHLQANYELY